MAIVYDKLFAMLKDKGYTTYKIRKTRLISEGTMTNLRNSKGGLDPKTLNRLCRALECQPGDLMEYVPDKEEESQ
ncbi:MAG: helix-turn-helix domain-containing protein [Clostridia bacterium]|nr:helix-turn-helix domain-containing protein [Clostridia bacterium]